MQMQRTCRTDIELLEIILDPKKKLILKQELVEQLKYKCEPGVELGPSKSVCNSEIKTET